jgi:hypothetical protein
MFMGPQLRSLERLIQVKLMIDSIQNLICIQELYLISEFSLCPGHLSGRFRQVWRARYISQYSPGLQHGPGTLEKLSLKLHKFN